MSKFTRCMSALVAATMIAGVAGSVMPETAAAADAAAPGATQAAPAPQTAAPAAAPATTGLGAPAPATETVSNPYGLDALWKGGDFVARGTLLILVIMSMGSWYIMVTKLFEQFKVLRRARSADERMWKANTLKDGVQQLENNSPFRFIAESGLDSAEHHEGALLEKVDLNTWVSVAIERAVNNVSSRLQDGLAFLGTVGSTAPFVGLFGTVWGIYHALTAIGIAGQASIDKVAGPVGEALIMTAIGLAVAVPAVLGYNWLVRRNKAVMERVRGFSVELHTVLLSQSPEPQTRPTIARVG